MVSACSRLVPEENGEQLELSTPAARWQWYRVQCSLAPDLCRFPVSLPGDVLGTSHATESAVSGPPVPVVSVEQVRSLGGLDSVSPDSLDSDVSDLVPEPRGAASHELVVFFQCGSKRYRVSACVSTKVSLATSLFCKLKGFDDAKVQFSRCSWGTRSLVRASSTVIRCTLTLVRWTKGFSVWGLGISQPFCWCRVCCGFARDRAVVQEASERGAWHLLFFPRSRACTLRVYSRMYTLRVSS